MAETHRNTSASSSSSLNSSFRDTEDDQTIASILAEAENSRADNRLGKRLSHLDSIPVRSWNAYACTVTPNSFVTSQFKTSGLKY